MDFDLVQLDIPPTGKSLNGRLPLNRVAGLALSLFGGDATGAADSRGGGFLERRRDQYPEGLLP